MRIKFNKEYIESYQMERVKEDAKFFSEACTLDDLRREFEEQTGEYFGHPEILKAEVAAMDSGWALGNVTIFEVNMVLDDWSKMYKIHFYITKDMKVDTRDLIGFNGEYRGKMYDIRKYTLA